mmetsp:Transcript_15110/g.16804  ORF Transcript_15110/g.16804 Transcript_15110/m.16804 type:complete len:475 (+) Transcript_15110:1-1425(+)
MISDAWQTLEQLEKDYRLKVQEEKKLHLGDVFRELGEDVEGEGSHEEPMVDELGRDISYRNRTVLNLRERRRKEMKERRTKIRSEEMMHYEEGYSSLEDEHIDFISGLRSDKGDLYDAALDIFEDVGPQFRTIQKVYENLLQLKQRILTESTIPDLRLVEEFFSFEMITKISIPYFKLEALRYDPLGYFDRESEFFNERDYGKLPSFVALESFACKFMEGLLQEEGNEDEEMQIDTSDKTPEPKKPKLKASDIVSEETLQSRILPQILSSVVLPRLKCTIGNLFDPFSARQNGQLVSLIGLLIKKCFSTKINDLLEKIKEILTQILQCFRMAIEEVKFPNSKKSNQFREFQLMKLVKLQHNLYAWTGIIPANNLQDMAINNIIVSIGFTQLKMLEYPSSLRILRYLLERTPGDIHLINSDHVMGSLKNWLVQITQNADNILRQSQGNVEETRSNLIFVLEMLGMPKLVKTLKEG